MTQNGGGAINSVPIIGNAEVVSNHDYDEIIIASLPGLYIIKNQLTGIGVPESKINIRYVSVMVEARINFLKDFAQLYGSDVRDYSVAEGGVFQGEFAKEINACFPKAKLYLFDTFEGFDKRDVEVENRENYSSLGEKHLQNTDEDVVLGKMPYKDNIFIRKGYFPETVKGLENERFLFVNLDFDLYSPTIEGLRFFIPRLVKQGIVLIHDYYNPGYRGIKEALSDFERECEEKIFKFPIGDHCSIGIKVLG